MYAVVAAHGLVWFGSVSRTMACLYLLPQKDVVWLFWTAPLQSQVSDCPPLKIPKYGNCTAVALHNVYIEQLDSSVYKIEPYIILNYLL